MGVCLQSYCCTVFERHNHPACIFTASTGLKLYVYTCIIIQCIYMLTCGHGGITEAVYMHACIHVFSEELN